MFVIIDWFTQLLVNEKINGKQEVLIFRNEDEADRYADTNVMYSTVILVPNTVVPMLRNTHTVIDANSPLDETYEIEEED